MARRSSGSRKTPGLGPNVGALRIKGVVHVFYSVKWQRYVARSWPRSNGGATPARLAAQAQFTQVQALIKESLPEDMIASHELANGTPYLPRDLRMKAAYGTLITATLRDGTVIQGGRNVSVNVSDLLDQITAVPGSLLQRGPDGWQAVPPQVVDGLIVAWDDATGLWTARAPAAGGGAGDDSIAPWLVIPTTPGFDPAMIYGTMGTLSNSNRTLTPASSSPYNHWYGTTARFAGKRYWEVVPGSTSFTRIGVCGAAGHAIDPGVGSANNFGQIIAGQIGWASDGTIKALGLATVTAQVTLATVATWSAGARLCFAVDLDNARLWCRVNGGNWNNSGTADPAAGTGALPLHLAYNGASNLLTWPGGNFGNTSASSLYLLAADCTQTIPTGYAGWANP